MERRSSSTDNYTPSDEEGILSKQNSQSNHRTKWLPQAPKLLFVHLSLILGYTLLFLILRHNIRSACDKHLVYCKKICHETHHSLTILLRKLNSVLVPERKFVHATFRSKNPFKGKPSPELDHAWHRLFVNSNVRVSASDLKKINKTSVPIGDGKGGYYAIPGGFTPF